MTRALALLALLMAGTAAAQEPPAPTPEAQLAAAADDLGAALAELDAALRERGVTTACVQEEVGK